MAHPVYGASIHAPYPFCVNPLFKLLEPPVCSVMLTVHCTWNIKKMLLFFIQEARAAVIDQSRARDAPNGKEAVQCSMLLKITHSHLRSTLCGHLLWRFAIQQQSTAPQSDHALRLISGTLRSTPLPWLPVLSNIEPPALRRKAATDKLVEKNRQHDSWPN